MNKLLLALLSGFLLYLSWPPTGFFPLVFVSFIPLLLLEKNSKNSRQVFGYSFLAFFIFNLFTTYWIYHATIFGSIAAFFVNATLMALTFWLFHKIKKVNSDGVGYFSFLVLWISMEYLHLNWDLSWPWLTLGNVFASFPLVIQWYEFTGFLGGSLWVLLTNLILFLIIQKQYDRNRLIFYFLFVLLIPIIISSYIFVDFEEIDNGNIDVMIIQPNVDPYVDKFSQGYQQQLMSLINLAETNLNQKIQLLLAPETALLEPIWEDEIDNTYSLKAFRSLQKKFPNLNVLTGANTYKLFKDGEKRTNTARELRDKNVFYDVYNSTVFIPNNGNVQFYHKTRLVPGVEKMPFPYILDPLAKYAVDLGGTSGSLGSINHLNSFLVNEVVVSPLICYESVYGEMRLGQTNLLAIITNDGWWKNTAGYKQHFQYARLRAIEQRKSIIRSANTGISGFINAKGYVLQQSDWDESVCLTSNVSVNNIQTFYNKYGDYIGRISVFMAILLFMTSFTKGMLRRSNIFL